MIPMQRLAIPLAVWIGVVGILLALTDVAALDTYRALFPFEMEPVLPVHGTIITLFAAFPMVLKPNMIWMLTFRKIAVLKALFMMPAFLIFGIDIPSAIAFCAVLVMVSLAPIRYVGYPADTFQSDVKKVLFAITALYTLLVLAGNFPAETLIMSVVSVSLIFVMGARTPHSIVLSELPSGFDWRNTPDFEHPGRELCPCPRHSMMRQQPGILALCTDCMRVFTEKPDTISRSTRFKIWFFKHIIVGKFMYLKLVKSSDECYFCNSSSGGLGGKIQPPPDVH